MARKAIRTISVTGVIADAGLVSAAPVGTFQTETDAVSAYGDSWVTNVPRNEGMTFGDLTFEFLNEGLTDDDISALIGTVAAITITTKYGDGKTSDTTKTVTFDLAIKSAGAGSTAVDGERKSTVTITGVRHTKANASQSSGAGGSNT